MFYEIRLTWFKRTSLSSSGAMQPTPTKAEARLNKTQTNKRDNKQPIGKQLADSQSEEDKSHRGERERKKKKQEGEKLK